MLTNEYRLPPVPPDLTEFMTFLELIANGDKIKRSPKNRYIEGMYSTSDLLYRSSLYLVKVGGDSPKIRQILYYNYLQQEPLFREVLVKYIYPAFQRGHFQWDHTKLKKYFHHLGLNSKDYRRAIRYLEKLLYDLQIPFYGHKEKFIKYQLPSVEAVAYALYVEYGGGYAEGRRFYLKNPPLKHILQHAAFPGQLLINPGSLPLLLEACRLKGYISLESRGGLSQYALIYEDVVELVQYMIQGGRHYANSRFSSFTPKTGNSYHYGSSNIRKTTGNNQ